jgi:hypothetical protein
MANKVSLADGPFPKMVSSLRANAKPQVRLSFCLRREIHLAAAPSPIDRLTDLIADRSAGQFL